MSVDTGQSGQGIVSAEELADMIRSLTPEYFSDPENVRKVQDVLREYERCRQLLAQQQKDFTQKIIEAEERTRTLEAELSASLDRYKAAEKEALEFRAAMTKREDELQRQIWENEQKIEASNSMLGSSTLLNASASASLITSAAHSQQVQELRSNISILGRELDNIAQRAQTAEHRANSASSRLHEAEKEVIEALELQSEAITKAATLETRNHELQASLILKDTEVAESLQANSTELERLRTEALNRSKEMAMQTEKIQKLTLQVTSLTNELTTLSKGSAQKLERIAGLESRVSFLAAELDARNSSVETLTTELHELTSHSNMLQTEINDARKQAIDADLLVSVMQKERDTLSFTLSERAEQLAQKASECAKLREEVDQVYTQLKMSEDERHKAELVALTSSTEKDKTVEANLKMQKEYALLQEQYDSSIKSREAVEERVRLNEEREKELMAVLRQRNDLIATLDPRITFPSALEISHMPELIVHENNTYALIDVYNAEIEEIRRKIERQHVQLRDLDEENRLLTEKLARYSNIVEHAERSCTDFAYDLREDQLQYSVLRKELLAAAENTCTYVIENTVGRVASPSLAAYEHDTPSSSNSSLKAKSSTPKTSKALTSSLTSLNVAEIARSAATSKLVPSRCLSRASQREAHALQSIPAMRKNMEVTYDVDGSTTVSRSISTSGSISPRLRDVFSSKQGGDRDQRNLKSVNLRMKETQEQRAQAATLENNLLKAKLRTISMQSMELLWEVIDDLKPVYNEDKLTKLKARVSKLSQTELLTIDPAENKVTLPHSFISDMEIDHSPFKTVFNNAPDRAEANLNQPLLFSLKKELPPEPTELTEKEDSMSIIRMPNSEIVKEYIVTFPAKESTVYHIHFELMRKKDAEAIRAIANCYRELFYSCQYQGYVIAKLEDYVHRVCQELKRLEYDMRTVETVHQQANSEFLVSVWDLMKGYIDDDTRSIEMLEKRITNLEVSASGLVHECIDSVVKNEAQMVRNSIAQATDRIAPFIKLEATDMHVLSNECTPFNSPVLVDKVVSLAVLLKQQYDGMARMDSVLQNVLTICTEFIKDESTRRNDFKKLMHQARAEVLKTYSKGSKKAV